MTYPLNVVDREPIKVLASILQAEMDLDDGQIMLANQQRVIPKNDGLYVAMQVIEERALSSVNRAEATEDGMIEIQEVVMQQMVQIDFMSWDDSARLRKEEFLMAMGSIKAQQEMEKYLVSIAQLPAGFVNVSEPDDTKMLNRYTITAVMQALLRKTKEPVAYFDKFPTTSTPEPEVIVNG